MKTVVEAVNFCHDLNTEEMIVPQMEKRALWAINMSNTVTVINTVRLYNCQNSLKIKNTLHKYIYL